MFYCDGYKYLVVNSQPYEMQIGYMNKYIYGVILSGDTGSPEGYYNIQIELFLFK